MKKKNVKWWIIWVLFSFVLSAYYAYALVGGGSKESFLPGETTHGHYQIELACGACHGDGFEGEEAIQKSCVRCHGAELKAVKDSHPKSKFTDPRNADRVAILDARVCVTCHIEHNPDVTREMGVTLADDFCFLCHQDIAEDRISHEGMEFDTCASAGCHNYHDNKALYEDFLVKHGNEKDIKSEPRALLKSYKAVYQLRTGEDHQALTREQADLKLRASDTVLDEWSITSHARSGVNCSGCHGKENEWRETPDISTCANCHETEEKGFLNGRHGMRLAQDLSPMRPSLARHDMKEDAADHLLGCHSCHKSHRYDTQKAAVEACLTCHNDEHSLNYKNSSHYQLWLKEVNQDAEEGTGVSCATCHMPREQKREKGEYVVLVQHNQNMNLRPNEKMIRSSCMNCHGLDFSINALADRALIQNGFDGVPKEDIKSVEMAMSREKNKRNEDL